MCGYTFGSLFNNLIVDWSDSMAAVMLSTCYKHSETVGTDKHVTSMQMWCIPPSGFLSRNDLMGLLSPSGCSNYGNRYRVTVGSQGNPCTSILVFPRSMNTVVTPCSASGYSYQGYLYSKLISVHYVPQHH